MRRIKNIFFSRITFVVLLVVIQLLALLTAIWKFSKYFVIFDFIFTFISILAVVYILNSRTDPTYKLGWIILIMLFPIFGGLLYLMAGGAGLSGKMKKNMSQIMDKMTEYLFQDQRTFSLLRNENIVAYNQGKYIEKYSYCPVYDNSSTNFFPSGEIFFQKLVKELKSAEKFIFIEFFIIEEGVMWNTILDILKDKVEKGVDVRVIYDDIGCMSKLPNGYNKKLEKAGVKCCVFNPFRLGISLRLNNRDHRKIIVIDGKTAYTGGINLADEYINRRERFGYWRDNAIEIKGAAIWSFTVMFLSMWAFLRKTNEDYSIFASPALDNNEKSQGYVQPFHDSPLDDEHVSETVYLNLINQAEKYIYIETPYLIADHKMMTALCIAAKRGVDVKILTPGIPDKKVAYAITQSSYEELLEAGVSMYQYTPGFNHGKTFVVDDNYAVVGTINLDYRSLYLHFECGVWMYNTKSVEQVKRSTIKALKSSKEITLEYVKNTSALRKILRTILKSLAPVL